MARKWIAASNVEFARQNEDAVREARDADRTEPRARSASFDAGRRLVLVELATGYVFGFAPERVSELARARAEQLATIRISPSGDGLHWDELDAHVSLNALMEEGLNLREWAPRYLGRLTSEAKARAARANGTRGGRPRKATGTALPAA